MSNNGESIIILKVEQQLGGKGLRAVFCEGTSFELASLALRLANLELDNRIIAQAQKKAAPPQVIPVPMTIIDKMRQGKRLD